MKRTRTHRSKAVFLAIFGLLLGSGADAIAQRVTGQWQFNGNFDAEVGTAATPNGTWEFTTDLIGGEIAQVARFTANSYLILPHGAAPNGGGQYVNQYSVIMDVKFPAGPWVSLTQTNTSNANDGDWFIREDGGMGISGNYTDEGNPLRFQRDTWQRIALVIDCTTPRSSGNDLNTTLYRSYINGALQNVVQSPGGWGRDGRHSLDPVILLFADNDGETLPGWVNSVQFRDYAMSPEEIRALGGPTAAGIGAVPEPGAIALLTAMSISGVVWARRRRK